MTGIGRIAIIGFGEVGSMLAQDLAARGNSQIIAWDIQFADPDSVASRALRTRPGVMAATCATAAVHEAELVISAVTAAADCAAAAAAAPDLMRDAWFMDLNSVAPATRRNVASIVEAGGARYVEAAVMSPISTRRMGAPMLLGGGHAREFTPLAQSLGFTGVRFFGPEIGLASAAKMCRSVIVKGMEALVAESLLAARHYRVEDEVLNSLGDLFPATDWPTMSRYMISRSIEHGRRRAEEMGEVAATLREAAVEPWMSVATGKRQEWAPRFAHALQHDDLVPLLDEILAGIHVASREVI